MMYRSDYQPDTLEASGPQAYSSSEATSPPQSSQRSHLPSSIQDVQNLLGELTPNKRAVIEALLTNWLPASESISYSDPTHFRHAS
ncbi:MAG: hypothetical protein ACFB8W_09725 [Elainellaceae cyanobacterium]